MEQCRPSSEMWDLIHGRNSATVYQFKNASIMFYIIRIKNDNYKPETRVNSPTPLGLE